MRIDLLLVSRGLTATRAQAQQLVAGGVLWRNGGAWQRVGKSGDAVPEGAELQVLSPQLTRYVSRGGLKLEGALADAGVRVTGATCLDVGQSTGGFTDCLLQHGAARVLGVDVGQAQLHPRMRADARVCALEQFNARVIDAHRLCAALAAQGCDGAAFAPALQEGFDCIVADLSFISQTLVLPALTPLLHQAGQLLTLVKPQFELQPGQVGKGGIVRDPALYSQVRQRIEACLDGLGLTVQHWLESRIEGGDGNHEFFVHATRNN